VRSEKREARSEKRVVKDGKRIVHKKKLTTKLVGSLVSLVLQSVSTAAIRSCFPPIKDKIVDCEQ